ncbi:DUF1330 domain-containing protein [Hahella ganghwensis]|uniref:DUF1330 domain-containing protein n=1 Tax=Hahella ganghwensis TaxID=286420 RepID=UPI0003774826|nr:DUF1330 domain-containing protein [Hahella ganghwensis]
MPILNFSYANIKDHDKFQQYVKAAAPLMEKAGVEVVARGSYSSTMKGKEENPHIAAVFRYPDLAAVERFYSSDQYKALIPLRDEACDMTINLYEE